ncbi:hypothetical protein G4B88_014867 [Cannabis sativa]|uniref:Carbamoyl-phosphate synthetase large subunit oligomerisation domain-containing protein n=1 Tax=Cannabis sativa TaxID=3483 RepID=A0A7J6IBG5_CANSA|nr:hypothetical protein G4B88_014867 [Cannabis sativa]
MSSKENENGGLKTSTSETVPQEPKSSFMSTTERDHGRLTTYSFLFWFSTWIPRFAFEKFPGSQPMLTTQMKLVDRIHDVCAKGMKIDDIHELSYIDIWFLTQLKELVDVEQFLLARIKLLR